MDIFPERLRELRTERNLTQNDLAKQIGVNKSAISFWELGTNEPKASYLFALSNFFEVSIDYLLGNNEEYTQQKEELTPSERELHEMYRGLSPEGKEKVLEYAEMVKGDEERKKVPHGGIFGKQRA